MVRIGAVVREGECVSLGFLGDGMRDGRLGIVVGELIGAVGVQGIDGNGGQGDAVAGGHVAIDVETVQYTGPAWIEGQRLSGRRIVTRNFAGAAMELGGDGDSADLRLARVATYVSARAGGA